VEQVEHVVENERSVDVEKILGGYVIRNFRGNIFSVDKSKTIHELCRNRVGRVQWYSLMSLG